MALLFQEGFDDYNTINELWKVKKIRGDKRFGTYSSSGGAFGGGRYQAAALSEGLRVPLRASPGSNMIRLAFWFKSNQAGSAAVDRPLFGFRNADDTRAWRCFHIGTAGATTLQVSRFDDTTAATLLTAGATVIGDNTWHHIEIALAANTATGELRSWIDGTVDANINITSGDTSDAASGDVTAFTDFIFGGVCSNTGGATDVLIDDVIVWDDSGTGFTGRLTDMHKIRNIAPSGAGSSTQFTPSAGANYAAVDDSLSDDDTTYVESSTTGNTDLYAFATIGYTPTIVYAVAVETSLKRTGIKAMNARNKIKQGATTVNGTTTVISPGHTKMETFQEQAPDGADWTAGKIVASEFGQEYVS
jgi:hypothetical protein